MNDKENRKGDYDLDNIELNKMFSLTYNFDILKYIITNIIKNQKKTNYKLIELKLEKTYSKQRVDQLECDIIDLQLLGNLKDETKNELVNRKNKLQSKDYTNKIDKYIKEKDSSLKSINNANQENILNEIIKNKYENVEEEEIEEEIKTSEKNVKKKELDEIYKKLDDIIEEMRNKFNDRMQKVETIFNEKMEKVETKFKSYEKMFASIDTNIKLSEEKTNNKFKIELPKIVDNIYSSKIITTEKKIENLDIKVDNNLKKLDETIKKQTEDRMNNLELKFQEKFQDINKKMKETFKDIGKINERINNCTPLNEYKKFVVDIDNKINKENKDINNEITKIKKIMEKMKEEINEIINDHTDHDNLVALNKKFDTLSTIIYHLREFQVEYEQDKKKLAQLEPSKFANAEIFNEFKDSTNKTIDIFKKNFTDIKYILDDLKSLSYNGQASLKDLRSLEDNIKNKIDEFREKIKEKYAEKNYVIKNNKYIQFEINQKLEDFKKNEQNSAWILAKKPIGLLCASCETYLGELKDIENEKKYVPWNKYPQKEPLDKIYRAGSGFSKMLQKIGSEKKLIKNKSVLDKDSKMKKRSSIDDTYIKQNYKNNLKKSIINQDNNSYDKLNNNEIPKIPIGNLIKNKTATDFMNIEDSFNKSDSRNTNYNNIFKKKNNSNLIKNKTFYGPKTDRDKDEIISFPTSLNKYRELLNQQEGSDTGPKIIKVYKKSINENKK